MNTRAATANPLPETILNLSVSGRVWNGVHVAVTEWRGFGRVVHRFPNETKTRLITLLEEVGSPSEPRLRENRPSLVGYTPRHINFAPAGLELWGYSADMRFVRDATLMLDLAALGEALGIGFDPDTIATPRLRFADDRVWHLVKLLSDTVNDPDPSTQLFGDGLTAAIATRLFSGPPGAALDSGGLAPWQLRRVFEYLDAHLPERVDLAHLAAMAGLSQSHFSRAFKASTGMAPYHWQLDKRVRHAQALLINSHASLEQVAEATGFADAVHFGRTFRKFIGATPAAWRRDRKD